MSDTAMQSRRITVRFPDELHRKLKQATRRTKTDFIRAAVERQLAAEEHMPTAYDLLKKSGLIGGLCGAKRDLNTNKKYFDGFGI